jgi:anti-sigma factor RsiW
MHTNEGTLRAYLDGELDAKLCAAVAAHLRECAACRKQLEQLASHASATSQYLQALAPRGAELPAPAPVALARLHARLAAETETRSADENRPASLDRPTGGLVEMFKRMFTQRYRAAWMGLAVVLVIAALFAFEPVRVAAGQFLGLFRVRQFAVVTVNPANLQNLEKSSGQIDQLLSDSVTFVKKPSAPVAVAGAAEASQKAGIPVRLPTTLSGTPRLTVEDGVDAKAKVDLARVRGILDAVGRSDIKLPDSLDGTTVEFNVPPMVAAEYGNCAAVIPSTREITPGQPKPALPSPAEARLSNCTVLMQLASPTVDAPTGLNINQLGEAALQVLGLSPQEAQHFSQTIDWSSTLIIPMPTDAGSFRDVTVEGVPGVLIQSNPRMGSAHYLLLWQKDGTVYALSGFDPTHAVEIANSLQ